jgi:high-affinity Fe2+/Pb2+ permease
MPEPRTDTGRDETELERRDRQFQDLLQELRVMQTGVQVLFALLLGVPFTQRFSTLDSRQRLLYFVVLLAAAAAILCLLAPGAWHRALFSRGDKAHVVEVSHRFAILGLAFVAVAVCGVVTLIATVLYPGAPAAVVAGGTALAFTAAWLVFPVARRRRVRDRRAPEMPAEP